MSEEELKGKAFVEYMTSKELENQKEIDFLKMKTDIEFLKAQSTQILEMIRRLEKRYL